jgi:hypothetical protein
VPKRRRCSSRRSIARDDLEGPKDEGFCYFHSQDTRNAVERGGLLLAFGAYKEGSPPLTNQPPKPLPCAICAGRGWTVKSAGEFPVRCACGGVVAKEPPARTYDELVGDKIVAACVDAGLTVEWSGSSSERIALPGFNWQRRFVNAQEADIRAFLDGWERALRCRTPGSMSIKQISEELEERAWDWFEPFANFSTNHLRRFVASTTRFLAELETAENTWRGTTAHDRLMEAFEEVGRAGLFAGESPGLSIQDGWAYVGIDSQERADLRGAAFYHKEDIVDAAEGRGLQIAFGALNVPADEDAAQTAAIGLEVACALTAHGVPWGWNGSAKTRIRIAPFEWQKRLWTQRPPSRASNLAPLYSSPFSCPSRIHWVGS